MNKGILFVKHMKKKTKADVTTYFDFLVKDPKISLNQQKLTILE